MSDLEHLRRIEDAERVLNQYHRLRTALIGSGMLSAAGIVASAQVLQTGGWAVGALVLSCAVLLAALGVLPWWIWWNHTALNDRLGYRKSAPGPAERLRAVRREYEDFLSSQARGGDAS